MCKIYFVLLDQLHLATLY